MTSDPPDRIVGLEVVFRGTRGSVPSPGRTTAGFGGNTPCVEVRTGGGRRYVFDAGTGIRELGREIAAGPGPLRTDLFLTHFHWDHIQGLPFFAPLYRRDAVVRIYAPAQEGVPPRDLLDRQMATPYFPVPLGGAGADLSVSAVHDAPWSDGTARVSAFRVCHPSHTVGYRLECGGCSVVYIPDNEIGAIRSDLAYRELAEFCAGADLLVHDAMYTPSESISRAGWGHSTHEEALQLAADAGVRRLRFFHHAPERADTELDAVVASLRETWARRVPSLDFGAAREGEVVALHRLGGA